MTRRGLISPPRALSGPNNAAANPRPRPNYNMSPPRRPTAAVNPREQWFNEHWGLTPAALIGRPMVAPNPQYLQNQIGDNGINYSIKTTSSRPATPPTHQQRLRNGPTQISNNKPKPKPAIDSPAANNANLMAQNFFESPNNSSPNHGLSGQRQDMSNNIANNGGTTYTSLAHPQLNNHLQRLSRDGSACPEIPIYVGTIPIYGGDDDIALHSKCPSQSNVPRIFQIYKDIASHRQGNSSVTSYFTKLKTIWDELETYNNDLSQCCSSGAAEKHSEHVDREKVMQFLVGLNDSYSTICHQILLIRPFPTVERAYSIVIREEKRVWS